MWKNGKEGNTEGRRIMEGTDGKREVVGAEEKNGAEERGDAAGEGRGAGSGRNVVGKTEWEETK